jgi:hypothetical protein
MAEGNGKRRIAAVAISFALLLCGGIAAYHQWWTADDAFISFRYARNFSEGRGLVFNEGERVEGYSNLLWTLWAAAGLALGREAEDWANLWGLIFYLGSILLLLLNHDAWNRRVANARWWIPVAAAGAVAHRDWNVWATGGMETSLFTFLLTASYLAFVWKPSAVRRLALSGLLSGLAALTRPDGLLPALVLGLFVVAYGRPRLRSALAYAIPFIALWLPFMAWRLWYYGDIVPNTYYARSAYLAWYGQGWHYLVLYFEKYWVLLFGPGLLLAVFLIRRVRLPVLRDEDGARWRLHVFLAAAIAAAYTFYVVRVGGDFMFARMLIPATPFYLILLERGLMAIFRSRPVNGYGALLILFVAMAVTPSPVSGSELRHGVADERRYCSGERTELLDHSAEVLGRYFEGLPVRVAFYGGEARVVYKARFAVAVESHSGLTEPEVAKRKLAKRGRVGHEKHAGAEYLIENRRAHFTFSSVPGKLLDLERLIPEVIVEFDEEVYGRALHWDPAMMDALRRRGALVPDYIERLDRYIERLGEVTDEEAREVYVRLRRFYFMHVDDPIRESAFKSRL